MLKKLLMAVVMMVMIFNVTGCWDAQDISEKSIVIVAALDLSKAMGTQYGNPIVYDATILLPNLNPDSPKKIRIEKVSGASLSGSRDQRAYIDPQIILVRMARVFIFGESLAISGLSPVLDSIHRNPQISSSLTMAVTEGQSGDLLTTEPQNSPDLGVLLSDMLSRINDKSFFPVVTLHDFIMQSTSPGRNPILPILRTRNGEVEVSGCGIFKKDKMIRTLNTEETRPLVLLRGNKGQAYVPFVIEQEGVLIDRGTIQAKNSRKVRVERDGDQFTFYIDVILEGNIIEHESHQRFYPDKQFFKTIEDSIAADLESECQDFVTRMQQDFQVDCIDINKYALAKWRSELEGSIDEDFISKVNIRVNVKVNLTNTGDII